MDTYTTIVAPAQGIYKEKGSKFLAFAFPVASLDAVKTLVETKRKEYHDARHVCYAYMLGAARTDFRVNDDGEPSGTAGKPILGQINANGLTNILIVVVRYFGGILLGTGGLTVAYKMAAAEALAAAQTVERLVEAHYRITTPYTALNRAMRLVKELQMSVLEQKQSAECELTVAVRQSHEEQLAARLEQMAFEGVSFSKID